MGLNPPKQRINHDMSLLYWFPLHLPSRSHRRTITSSLDRKCSVPDARDLVGSMWIPAGRRWAHSLGAFLDFPDSPSLMVAFLVTRSLQEPVRVR